MSAADGALAGLIAGWVCFVAGHWMSIVGLPNADLGALGRRYLDAAVPGWVFGVIHHLVNSTLLGALYAVSVVEVFDDGSRLSLVAGVAIGVGFGVLVWAVLAMSLVMPGSGRGWFGSRLEDRRPVVSNLAVHLVFGAVLGAVAR